eukprot:12722011-Alexandrium_andersonii.AAC.1
MDGPGLRARPNRALAVAPHAEQIRFAGGSTPLGQTTVVSVAALSLTERVAVYDAGHASFAG